MANSRGIRDATSMSMYASLGPREHPLKTKYAKLEAAIAAQMASICDGGASRLEDYGLRWTKLYQPTP